MLRETAAIEEKSSSRVRPGRARVLSARARRRDAPAFPQRESALAVLWGRAHTLSDGLLTEDGRRFRVVYPGRPSGRAGPDFRDSVISTDGGRLITGDVELHLEAPDWGAHGHGSDPNYNGVILHVVLRAKGEVSSSKQSRIKVPVASLEPVVGQLDGPDTTDRSGVFPWADLPQGAMETLLELAGDSRFLARSRGFARELEAGDAAQALYAGLFEALGYAANRRPFRRLAEIVPLSIVATLGGEPRASRLLAIQALLLNAAGMLPFAQFVEETPSLDGLLKHLPRTKKLPAGAWRLFRVRPANHPARRVMGAARLLDRYCDTGLLAYLETAVDPRSPSVLVRALAAPPYVGAGRAREMAVNVVLPFMHALAGVRRHGQMAARCLQAYRSFPGLGDNEITREMRRLLATQGHSMSTEGARRHQGLTHLYNLMTRPEVARSEWPSMLRAVGSGAGDDRDSGDGCR